MIKIMIVDFFSLCVLFLERLLVSVQSVFDFMEALITQPLPVVAVSVLRGWKERESVCVCGREWG